MDGHRIPGQSNLGLTGAGADAQDPLRIAAVVIRAIEILAKAHRDG
jgi:hypothetical protein